MQKSTDLLLLMTGTAGGAFALGSERCRAVCCISWSQGNIDDCYISFPDAVPVHIAGVLSAADLLFGHEKAAGPPPLLSVVRQVRTFLKGVSRGYSQAISFWTLFVISASWLQVRHRIRSPSRQALL